MVRISNVISAVDTHTAGEPTRIITGGIPSLNGSTIIEKREYFFNNFDHIRRALMLEPRGHRNMFGAILTPPCDKHTDWGLIFIDACGNQVNMCGHATIGTAVALVQLGIVQIESPETIIKFETPAGLVFAHVLVKDGEAHHAWIESVPAYLHKSEVPVDVPGLGQIYMDIAFGGNFFGLVSAEELGIKIEPANANKLIDLGMRIRESLSQEINIWHLGLAELGKVELIEFMSQPRNPNANSRNVVIGNGSLDRSPCGSGTCAKMAVMYAKGELKLNERFVHESIIDTSMVGWLVRETKVDKYSAVVPCVGGDAYIIGIQQFVIDPDDPLKFGFDI